MKASFDPDKADTITPVRTSQESLEGALEAATRAEQLSRVSFVVFFFLQKRVARSAISTSIRRRHFSHTQDELEDSRKRSAQHKEEKVGHITA